MSWSILPSLPDRLCSHGSTQALLTAAACRGGRGEQRCCWAPAALLEQSRRRYSHIRPSASDAANRTPTVSRPDVNLLSTYPSAAKLVSFVATQRQRTRSVACALHRPGSLGPDLLALLRYSPSEPSIIVVRRAIGHGIQPRRAMSQQLPTPASTPTSAGASSPKQEQLISTSSRGRSSGRRSRR